MFIYIVLYGLLLLSEILFILFHRKVSHLNKRIVILGLIKTFISHWFHRIKFICNFLCWPPRSRRFSLRCLIKTIVTSGDAEFTNRLLKLRLVLKWHRAGAICRHSLNGCISRSLDSIWVMIINYCCRWVVSIVLLLAVLLLKTILRTLNLINTSLIHLAHHAYSLSCTSHVWSFINLTELSTWR